MKECLGNVMLEFETPSELSQWHHCGRARGAHPRHRRRLLLRLLQVAVRPLWEARGAQALLALLPPEGLLVDDDQRDDDGRLVQGVLSTAYSKSKA